MFETNLLIWIERIGRDVMGLRVVRVASDCLCHSLVSTNANWCLKILKSGGDTRYISGLCAGVGIL